ncbi:hypothetical protein MHM88_14480 [Epibacterium sp. MM17-32]|uniref:hypothetical protein n=1 Tax=Epibacterium sp. MM17-32 TaxID=2917734 RepID=UPI001EF74569|nr:hypothetical protein [Epibacterium sp. MM17-32]MCG7629014.1 hypothetical protein [Epibacterium sp. MM17-32]
MNIQLLTEIRDWLAAGAPEDQAHGFEFDMWRWLEVETTDTPQGWCGTACCIAGAALVFGDLPNITATVEGFAPGQPLVPFDYHTSDLAAELLDIDGLTAEKLFEPWHYFEDVPRNPTPSHAAEVLTRLIETGEVKW